MQLKKADSPIYVTEDGIIIWVSKLQRANAYGQISVSYDGNMICVSELQLEKAPCATDFTYDDESGDNSPRRKLPN